MREERQGWYGKDYAQKVYAKVIPDLPNDDEHSRAINAEWWDDEVKSWLGQTFGPRADDALAAANRWVARDPRLAQFLHFSRLGSHPEIVKFVVGKAYKR